jgi:hypothetical protein
MYKITCTYDENPVPVGIWSYSDALQAFEEFGKFIDWGFADKHSTVNLTMPDGKMYTRIFYREGRKVVTK